MMTTFADLGIPFPLFEAPVKEASNYVGVSTCMLCGAQDVPCFTRCSVIVTCPSCGAEREFRGSVPDDRACKACSAKLPCPSISSPNDLRVCYTCVRAGRCAMWKDSELGMIFWDHATGGLTCDAPKSLPNGFEVDPDGGGARVPVHDLLELLRTPDFVSWQQQQWLFCCRRPMVYMGEWRNVVADMPHEARREFFGRIVDPAEKHPDLLFEYLQPEGNVAVCQCIFRCATCGRLRSYTDLS